MEFKNWIRDIPNFPRPGIVFKDITPLLQSPQTFAAVLEAMAEKVAVLKPTQIVAIESRGFIFGAPLSLKLGVGFVPARKPGKLPGAVHAQKYDLEYGHDVLEMHRDALSKNERVLIVDDLLATGGTAQACQQLVAQTGAVTVGFAFLIELKSLKGRSRFTDTPVISLVDY